MVPFFALEPVTNAIVPAEAKNGLGRHIEVLSPENINQVLVVSKYMESAWIL